MTTEEIKMCAGVWDKNKVPYRIVMDNGEQYNNGIDGSVVIWAPESQLAVSVRSNAGTNQSARPIQVTTLHFDHIEAIEVNLKHSEIHLIKEAIDAVGRTDVSQQVMDAFAKSDIYTKISTNASTGDGILSRPDDNPESKHWDGRVHTHAGDDFSAEIPLPNPDK